MSSPIKLTPALRDMLRRIEGATDKNGSLMTLVIAAAGGSELRKMRRLMLAGWAENCNHELPAGPVGGVRITDLGRAALSSSRSVS